MGRAGRELGRNVSTNTNVYHRKDGVSKGSLTLVGGPGRIMDKRHGETLNQELAPMFRPALGTDGPPEP